MTGVDLMEYALVIAYLILVHRLPEQFKRMFRAIHAPGNHYLIHVDKRSGPELAADIAAFLEPYANTALLEPRNMLWGGYSLVDTELRGMARLLEMGADWTYFINLSGQDFPLKSQGYIADFLTKNAGTEYIRALDQQAIRPDTMNRLTHYFLEFAGRIVRTGIRRPALRGATPYIGTQWKAVTRAFCSFVCNDTAVRPLKRYYRRTLIADEGFFQTVMMNIFPGAKASNDDLRTIDWVPDGDIKLRPRTFVARDALRLTLSPDLFARKFDSNVDSAILDILEAHLQTPAAMSLPADIEPHMSVNRAKRLARDDFKTGEPA